MPKIKDETLQWKYCIRCTKDLIIFGDISIWDGTAKSLIKQISKTTVKTMVDTINTAIKNMK